METQDLHRAPAPPPTHPPAPQPSSSSLAALRPPAHAAKKAKTASASDAAAEAAADAADDAAEAAADDAAEAAADDAADAADAPAGGDGSDDTPTHYSSCVLCTDETEGRDLLLCERCPNCYHPSCVGLAEMPPDSVPWYCPRCAKVVERQAARDAERAAKKAQRDAERATERAAAAAARAAEKNNRDKERRKADAEAKAHRARVSGLAAFAGEDDLAAGVAEDAVMQAGEPGVGENESAAAVPGPPRSALSAGGSLGGLPKPVPVGTPALAKLAARPPETLWRVPLGVALSAVLLATRVASAENAAAARATAEKVKVDIGSRPVGAGAGASAGAACASVPAQAQQRQAEAAKTAKIGEFLSAAAAAFGIAAGTTAGGAGIGASPVRPPALSSGPPPTASSARSSNGAACGVVVTVLPGLEALSHPLVIVREGAGSRSVYSSVIAINEAWAKVDLRASSGVVDTMRLPPELVGLGEPGSEQERSRRRELDAIEQSHARREKISLGGALPLDELLQPPLSAPAAEAPTRSLAPVTSALASVSSTSSSSSSSSAASVAATLPAGPRAQLALLAQRPVPVRDTYGLFDDQFGDALQVWDFLRTFAAPSSLVGRSGGSAAPALRPPLLDTSALATGETDLAVSPLLAISDLLQRQQLPLPAAPAGESVVAAAVASAAYALCADETPLPLPLVLSVEDGAGAGAGTVASALRLQGGDMSALGGPVDVLNRPAGARLSCVDPALASLADFVAALRGTSVRSLRFLSRCHVALLRLLIADCDAALDRVANSPAGSDLRSPRSLGGGFRPAGADEADEAYESEGDDNEGRAAAVGRPKLQRPEKLSRAALANSYAEASGERERSLEAKASLLGPQTWPEVLRRALLFGPLGATLRPHVSPQALRAAAALADGEYAALSVGQRLALLKALVDCVGASERFSEHMDDLGSELELEIRRYETERDADEAAFKEALRTKREALREREKEFEPFIEVLHRRDKEAKEKAKEDKKKALQAKKEAQAKQKADEVARVKDRQSGAAPATAAPSAASAAVGATGALAAAKPPVAGTKSKKVSKPAPAAAPLSTPATPAPVAAGDEGEAAQRARENTQATSVDATEVRLAALRGELAEASRTNDLPRLQAALAVGVDAGFVIEEQASQAGRGKAGKAVAAMRRYEPEQALAMRALDRLTVEHEEQAQRLDHDRRAALRDESFARLTEERRVRALCLGSDAQHRHYWLFAADRSRVFVEEAVEPAVAALEAARGAARLRAEAAAETWRSFSASGGFGGVAGLLGSPNRGGQPQPALAAPDDRALPTAAVEVVGGVCDDDDAAMVDGEPVGSRAADADAESDGYVGAGVGVGAVADAGASHAKAKTSVAPRPASRQCLLALSRPPSPSEAVEGECEGEAISRAAGESGVVVVASAAAAAAAPSSSSGAQGGSAADVDEKGAPVAVAANSKKAAVSKKGERATFGPLKEYIESAFPAALKAAAVAVALHAPELAPSRWYYFDNLEDLHLLRRSLDLRGARASALAEALARYEPLLRPHMPATRDAAVTRRPQNPFGAAPEAGSVLAPALEEVAAMAVEEPPPVVAGPSAGDPTEPAVTPYERLRRAAIAVEAHKRSSSLAAVGGALPALVGARPVRGAALGARGRGLPPVIPQPGAVAEAAVALATTERTQADSALEARLGAIDALPAVAAAAVGLRAQLLALAAAVEVRAGARGWTWRKAVSAGAGAGAGTGIGARGPDGTAALTVTVDEDAEGENASAAVSAADGAGREGRAAWAARVASATDAASFAGPLLQLEATLYALQRGDRRDSACRTAHTLVLAERNGAKLRGRVAQLKSAAVRARATAELSIAATTSLGAAGKGAPLATIPVEGIDDDELSEVQREKGDRAAAVAQKAAEAELAAQAAAAELDAAVAAADEAGARAGAEAAAMDGWSDGEDELAELQQQMDERLRVDAKDSGGDDTSASLSSRLRYGALSWLQRDPAVAAAALPFSSTSCAAAVLLPSAVTHAYSGEPIFAPQAGRDALRVVFALSREDEQEAQEGEAPEDAARPGAASARRPLWSYRSERRWWRAGVRVARSLAHISLQATALHRQCAEARLCSEPPLTLRALADRCDARDRELAASALANAAAAAAEEAEVQAALALSVEGAGAGGAGGARRGGHGGSKLGRTGKGGKKGGKRPAAATSETEGEGAGRAAVSETGTTEDEKPAKRQKAIEDK